MEIADLVAEYVALARQAKSAPLAAEQENRMKEVKELLLAAQRQPVRTDEGGPEGKGRPTRR